jgi:hypothetical protein
VGGLSRFRKQALGRLPHRFPNLAFNST